VFGDHSDGLYRPAVDRDHEVLKKWLDVDLQKGLASLDPTDCEHVVQFVSLRVLVDLKIHYIGAHIVSDVDYLLRLSDKLFKKHPQTDEPLCHVESLGSPLVLKRIAHVQLRKDVFFLPLAKAPLDLLLQIFY
jgi:hypothetical protein